MLPAAVVQSQGIPVPPAADNQVSQDEVGRQSQESPLF